MKLGKVSKEPEPKDRPAPFLAASLKATGEFVTREEFEELEKRVNNIQKALTGRAEELRHVPDDELPTSVPGFTVVDDPDDPDGKSAEIDMDLVPTWTEGHMIVVGKHFKAVLDHLRGKPKVMRDTLYKVMAAQGVEVPKGKR